jgi:hypothetical protein
VQDELPRRQHPRSMNCSIHGSDREVGCGDCIRAGGAAKFWRRLEVAAGRKFDEATRIGIASVLDAAMWMPLPRSSSRRGPRVKGAPDEIIECLAVIFRSGGRKPSIRIGHRHPISGARSPGFTALLCKLRPELPKHCQLQDELAFLRRARDVLRYARSGDGSSKSHEAITLRISCSVSLSGHRPGDVFNVPAAGGRPVNRYWRDRLAEGAVTICG